MDVPQGKLDLPPEPPSIGKATFIGAVIAPILLGAAAGAAVLLTKLPYFRSSQFWTGYKDMVIKNQTARNYIGLTFAGGLLGNIMGSQERERYALKVENVQLQNKVAALETDKSFTRAILQEKIDDIKSPQRGV